MNTSKTNFRICMHENSQTLSIMERIFHEHELQIRKNHCFFNFVFSIWKRLYVFILLLLSNVLQYNIF